MMKPIKMRENALLKSRLHMKMDSLLTGLKTEEPTSKLRSGKRLKQLKQRSLTSSTTKTLLNKCKPHVLSLLLLRPKKAFKELLFGMRSHTQRF